MKLLIEKVSKLKIEWLNIIKDCNQLICLLQNIKGMISILTAQNRIFMGWPLKTCEKNWCPQKIGRKNFVDGSQLKYFRYFKRSKDREFDEDEFIPINVHLQNFNIGKIADYKTISCGAAAAHSKGFKGSNGLWQHLEVSVDDQIPDEG